MTLPLLVALGNPAGLLALLAAIPIVVLFLLRRRRRRVPVSSTLLWARVLREDLARQPFRQPREWLSLLLLLLATGVLALALADLRFGSGGGSAESLILVVDTSASMGTREDGATRLEQALDGARAALLGAKEGTRLTVIASASSPRMIVHGEDDQDVVEAALRVVRVEPVEGDLVAGLGLAESHALDERAQGRTVVLVVLSDFAADEAVLRSLDVGEVPVTFVRCGSAVPNAGITALSLSSAADGTSWLLAQVERSGPAGPRNATLRIDDRIVDARAVEGVAGDTVSVLFPVPFAEDAETARISVRLEPADGFPLDDTAWLGATRRAPPTLLVIGEEDPFLARLPDVFQGASLRFVPPEEAGALAATTARPYDLVIVTASVPTTDVPAAMAELWMGCAPADGSLGSEEPLDDPVLLDWDRRDPILEDVGFEELLVLRSIVLTVSEERRALVRVQGGPQLVRVPTDEGTRYLWASAPSDSNFLLLPAFPLFVRNLLRGGAAAWEGHGQPAVVPLRVPAGLDRVLGDVELLVTAEDGTEHRAQLGSRESFTWPGVPPLGFLTATAQSPNMKTSRTWGVSLLAPRETTHVPSDPKAMPNPGVSATVTTLASWSPETPRWAWCVLFGVVLLAGEAWIWSRARD